VPIGTILDYASPIAPSNYLNCDGSAISRTTYADLFSKISFTESGTLTNTFNTVSGLTNATTRMYVGMSIEGTNIPGGTTIASIVDDNNITMSATATGSGASTIRFFSWGNGDGSTTFNIPDLRRSVAMGSGGSATAEIGKIVGQSGGEESHAQTIAELASHVHAAAGGGQFLVSEAGGLSLPAAGANLAALTNTDTTGSGTAFNIIQPSVITYKIIKFI
jgi:microcystin-dependent protein